MTGWRVVLRLPVWCAARSKALHRLPAPPVERAHEHVFDEVERHHRLIGRMLLTVVAPAIARCERRAPACTGGPWHAGRRRRRARSPRAAQSDSRSDQTPQSSPALWFWHRFTFDGWACARYWGTVARDNKTPAQHLAGAQPKAAQVGRGRTPRTMRPPRTLAGARTRPKGGAGVGKVGVAVSHALRVLPRRTRAPWRTCARARAGLVAWNRAAPVEEATLAAGTRTTYRLATVVSRSGSTGHPSTRRCLRIGNTAAPTLTRPARTGGSIGLLFLALALLVALSARRALLLGPSLLK